MNTFTALLNNHERLQERKRRSVTVLTNIRGRLEQPQTAFPDKLCVYAAGSLARHETGHQSDLDVFFIAGGSPAEEKEANDSSLVPPRSISRLEEIQTFSELIRVNQEFNLSPFSGDGRYLKIHQLKDIIQGTGGATDDSENLFTTRLLLLLESAPLFGTEVYQEAITQILEMYFRDGRGKKDFRPLFLINDILRYWRTLCLNYERDRAEPGKPWWKRNLNLKFPRKLTVFSTILCIIACRIEKNEAMRVITNMTPMERLAHALDCIGDTSLADEYQCVLNDYEDFLEAKSHNEIDKQALTDQFSLKANRFNDFLHCALRNQGIDQNIVKFLLI